MTIRVSEKMMNEFDEALKINEETKSEIIRACIRNYIIKNKTENK